MKILSIVGARPQFVKEAIVQNEIRKYSDIIEVVVHTGQHFDFNMSESFFNIFEMNKPNYNLGINSLSHTKMTAEMMIRIEEIIDFEMPDYVLLYGDTNSTLAAALVCSKKKIKSVHIEAGLRQEPKTMPEEINRVVTDHISDFLFAPTALAIENLEKEFLGTKSFLVGDIMYDIFLKMKPYFKFDLYEDFNLFENDYFLLTLHRDFNVDNKNVLTRILTQINKISKVKKVIFPVHPRTKNQINKYNLDYLLEDVIIISPLNYLEIMGLASKAYKIITDSGGLQKEAYFLNKKSIVLMEDTSWRELIDIGWNVLANSDDIFKVAFEDKDIKTKKNIFGNGDSTKRIIEHLINDYEGRKKV